MLSALVSERSNGIERMRLLTSTSRQLEGSLHHVRSWRGSSVLRAKSESS